MHQAIGNLESKDNDNINKINNQSMAKKSIKNRFT